MAVEAGCCFTWKSPLADEACMPHNPSLFQWAHDLYQQQQRSWQYTVSFYFISGPGKGKVITLENAQKVTGVDKTRQAKVPLSLYVSYPLSHFISQPKLRQKGERVLLVDPKKTPSLPSYMYVVIVSFQIFRQISLSLYTLLLWCSHILCFGYVFSITLVFVM